MSLLPLMLACGTAPDPDAVRTDVEAIVMTAAARPNRPGYRLQLLVPRGAAEHDMKPEGLLTPILPVIDAALTDCPVEIGLTLTGVLHLDGLGEGQARADFAGPGACLDASMRKTWMKALPEVAADLPWTLEVTEPRTPAVPAEGAATAP